MFRGLASRCLEPVTPKKRARALLRDPLSTDWSHLSRSDWRFYAERRRRSGDGRKRDIFEERSAASQDEYFRRETARQLKALRDNRLKRKKVHEQDEEEKGQPKKKAKKENVDESSSSSPSSSPSSPANVDDDVTTKLDVKPDIQN